MKILVTGASGFIGQNLVARLLKQGHTVRAIYRRNKVPIFLSDYQKEVGDRLELIQADLDFKSSMPAFSDPLCQAWLKSSRNSIPPKAYSWPIKPDDFNKAHQLLEHSDACVHIAARVGDWGSRQEFFASNVNPVRILLEAARQHGIRRFVYCSSISVHGFGHRDSNELGPYRAIGHWYPRSKRLAESLVHDAIDSGLDALIVRPGNVYGPGDTTTFYPFFAAMEKGLGGTMGGGRSLTCPVFIDDLVSGMIQALAVDRPAARCFNLTSGEIINWRELTDLSSDALGLPRTWINLPGVLVYLLAMVGEAAFRIIRSSQRPPFTWYMVRQVLQDYHFSIETARTVLGYHPCTLVPEGIRRTAEAYQADKARLATITNS